jgi:hypothetical protein
MLNLFIGLLTTQTTEAVGAASTGGSNLGAIVFFTGLIILILFIASLAPFAFIYYRRYSLREARSLDYAVLWVKPAKFNEVKIEAAEAMFASLAGIYKTGVEGLVKGQDDIGFEIVARNDEIFFYVTVPLVLKELVEKTIHSYYPESEIIPVPDYELTEGKYVDLVELSLRAKPFKAIRRFKEFGEHVPQP